MLADLVGWTLISLGLLTLTEGYHAFRRRTERLERPVRFWWIAGLIGGIGLGLISVGFGLKMS